KASCSASRVRPKSCWRCSRVRRVEFRLSPSCSRRRIRLPADSPERKRNWRRWLLIAAFLAWAGMALWHTNKPLAAGTHIEGPWVAVEESDLEFIADITTADAYGRPILSQAIFDEVLGIVRSARSILVLDYFLFNSQHGVDLQDAPARALTSELR